MPAASTQPTTAPTQDTLIVRRFSGELPYLPVWQAMQQFTASRNAQTADELWLLEHQPVYTFGQAGKPEHLLNAGGTPVEHSDRGGQVTWHGPGQLMIYTLLDCQRRQLGARTLVSLLEQLLIDLLAAHDINAHARTDAPGVYVMQAGGEAKIAALGLRIRKAGCYHGAALNIAPDLSAFAGINPCGHAGMAVTSLAELLPRTPCRTDIEQSLVMSLMQQLGYRDLIECPASGLPAFPRNAKD